MLGVESDRDLIRVAVRGATRTEERIGTVGQLSRFIGQSLIFDDADSSTIWHTSIAV